MTPLSAPAEALIAEPGVYQVPADVYHADRGVCPAPSLSSTGARKIVSECPAVYWYEREHPPAPTAALDVGTAAHEWLLEGDTWPQRFAVLPSDHDGRSAAGKARLREIEEAGKRPLKAEDFAAIRAMVDAVRRDDIASSVFVDGVAEQSVYWRDAETAIWCRARPDWLRNTGRVIADYKTARSLREDDLRRAIAEHGYAQQASWYCDAVKAVGLIERPLFVFVFQMKTPPYLCRTMTLGETSLACGSLLNRHARRLFAHGLRTGQWPGYASDVEEIDLPDWRVKQIQAAHEAGLYETVQAPIAAE